MWQARPSFSGAVRVVMTFLVEGAAYSVRPKCGGLKVYVCCRTLQEKEKNEGLKIWGKKFWRLAD